MKKYITEGLNEYLNRENKPWHMPGHKRKAIDAIENNVDGVFVEEILGRANLMDVTEVPGLDDLHHPEEMIKKSMDELKMIYGTLASYYLVNGSTCGIFAAITACVKHGDSILVARNCHKSVYNIIELLELKPVYIEPKKIQVNGDESTIYGGINKNDVENQLKQHKDIKCVVLTSPTYEGVLSDIEGISEVTKKNNIPLIVDEAHGAHLPFMGIVKSAIYSGADIVIQSLHKTLPAYTQTAILHVVKDNELNEQVKKYLSFYMTSSPSYIFMANMECAIAYAKNANWDAYYERTRQFRNKVKSLNNICLLEKGDVAPFDGYEYDETRLTLISNHSEISGSCLEKMLYEYGNIVCEMSGVEYVVLISTVMDCEDDFNDLYKVLLIVDEEIDGFIECAKNQGSKEQESKGQGSKNDEKNHMILSSIKNMENQVAKGKIYVYPPGIPIVAKGEVITKEHIATMEKQIKSGKSLRVEGI